MGNSIKDFPESIKILLTRVEMWSEGDRCETAGGHLCLTNTVVLYGHNWQRMVVPKPCQRLIIFLVFALVINIIVYLITPSSPSHVKRRFLEQYQHAESSVLSDELESLEIETEEDLSAESLTESDRETQTETDSSS